MPVGHYYWVKKFQHDGGPLPVSLQGSHPQLASVPWRSLIAFLFNGKNGGVTGWPITLQETNSEEKPLEIGAEGRWISFAEGLVSLAMLGSGSVRCAWGCAATNTKRHESRDAIEKWCEIWTWRPQNVHSNFRLQASIFKIPGLWEDSSVAAMGHEGFFS